MRVIKKYLIFSIVLFMYVSVAAILLQQFFMYRRAYLMLGALLSHPTLEAVYLQETEGEVKDEDNAESDNAIIIGDAFSFWDIHYCF